MTRKRHSLVQNTSLNSNACIMKSNLQEAWAEISVWLFVFIKTIFLTYLWFIFTFIPQKICFQKSKTEECALTSMNSFSWSFCHTPCHRKELFQADSSFPHIDCSYTSDNFINHLCGWGNYSFSQFNIWRLSLAIIKNLLG